VFYLCGGKTIYLQVDISGPMRPVIRIYVPQSFFGHRFERDKFRISEPLHFGVNLLFGKEKRGCKLSLAPPLGFHFIT
jgi:hypothetical protein